MLAAHTDAAQCPGHFMIRLFTHLRDRIRRRLHDFRLELARPDAILALSILGAIAGVLAAVTIIALRLLVEWGQRTLFPGVPPEQYELLAPELRLLAPLGGGVLVALLFRLTPADSHRVGVTHILERLAYHQGRLPWRNALVQFVGGAISMISGHSVGREGPSAHLGTASSNLPAQMLDLPNNSLRVLAACGAAAGIAASFNTPLAGAAFAMEVLLLEYTVAGFAPVILATVSATALTRAVFGNALAYDVPPLTLGHLTELPWILFGGVLFGLVGAGFNALFKTVAHQGTHLPEWLRPLIGGLLVGLCGLAVPAVLGIGDDTVDHLLRGEDLVLLSLLLILVFKIIATAGGIGLGLPGGAIGPILFIGAVGGALFGLIGARLGFNAVESIGLYAMLGMGAMMACTLQAPMAGLIAILELTGNPNFIMPGMLAVVAATITAGRVGRRESLFMGLLRSWGMDYRDDPISQSLRRVGVAGIMNRKVTSLPRMATAEAVDAALADNPTWIVVRDTEGPDILLPAVDLARARKEQPDAESFDLLAIPADRRQGAPIDLGATLLEAQQKMAETGADLLYVISQTVPGVPRIYGVIGREDVESAYRL